MKRALLVAGMVVVSSLAQASNNALRCEDNVTVYLGSVAKTSQMALRQMVTAKGINSVLTTREIPLRSMKVHSLEEGVVSYVEKGTEKTLVFFDDAKLKAAIDRLQALEAKKEDGKMTPAEGSIAFSDIFSDVLVSEKTLEGVQAEMVVRFAPFEALNYFGKQYDPTLDIVDGVSVQTRIDVDAKEIRMQLQKEIMSSSESLKDAKEAIVGTDLSILALAIIQSEGNGNLITKQQRTALFEQFIKSLPDCKTSK